MPDSTTRPPALVARSTVSSDYLLPDRVDGDVHPAEQDTGLGRSSRRSSTRRRRCVRRTPRITSSGATTSVAPNARASSRWRRCLATTVIRAGVGELAQRERRRTGRPRRRRETSTDAAGRHLRPQRGVHGAGQRLDQHGPLVGQPVRHRRAAGCGARPARSPQPPPVSAQKPVCRPGRDVADGDPVAAVGAAGARRRRRARRRRAAQVSTGSMTTRVPRRQVLAVLEQLAHRPRGPGTNGIDTSAEKYRLVRPDERAEVGPADAGQPGPQPRPARAPDRRLVDGDQPQRRRGPDSIPGIRPPIALRGQRSRGSDRNISSASIMRAHPPASGRRARAAASSRTACAQSTIGQRGGSARPVAAARRARRRPGCRRPPAAAGRSGESA